MMMMMMMMMNPTSYQNSQITDYSRLLNNLITKFLSVKI